LFCGVENEDIFSPRYPEFQRVLLDGLRFLLRGVVLHDAAPEWESYKQGEKARVTAFVENFSTRSRAMQVTVRFLGGEPESLQHEETVSAMLKPGESRCVAVEWAPRRYDLPLYRIEFKLSDGSDVIDAVETGFVVWDPHIIARGIQPEFRNNYFQIRGRSEFLVGTRTNGLHLHGQVDEGVLDWRREFAAMRDAGMRVVSPVFFSEFVPGLAWGKSTTPVIPEPVLRIMDAQVQLAQEYGLTYAPCIFFLAKYLAIEESDLTRKICEEIGKRYASVPGIFFYIFDDGSKAVDVDTFRKWARICKEGINAEGRSYVILAAFGARTHV